MHRGGRRLLVWFDVVDGGSDWLRKKVKEGRRRSATRRGSMKRGESELTLVAPMTPPSPTPPPPVPSTPTPPMFPMLIDPPPPAPAARRGRERSSIGSTESTGMRRAFRLSCEVRVEKRRGGSQYQEQQVGGFEEERLTLSYWFCLANESVEGSECFRSATRRALCRIGRTLSFPYSLSFSLEASATSRYFLFSISRSRS